jgi:hypothetical protein
MVYKQRGEKGKKWQEFSNISQCIIGILTQEILKSRANCLNPVRDTELWIGTAN